MIGAIGERSGEGSRERGRRARDPLAFALVLAVVLALAGCDTVVEGPLTPTPIVAPESRTPTAAVERLVWSWQQRDSSALRMLFPANFRFVAAPSDTDTTGAPILTGGEWFRSDELAASARLFVLGSGGRPAATAITIVLDSLLADVPDPRPGKHARWHRAVEVGSVAGIRLPSGYYRVEDRSRFFLVRGDSAQIPLELQNQGVRPDSTWWWMDQWEDLGVPSGAPGAFLDYARLKALYWSH